MSDGACECRPESVVTTEADQDEVIAFLADPATHGGAAVERVDTHISRIFLAGDRVWKMKRALRTNYLDFSTLERREASCRRELEVNRTAGDIYIGVTAVVRRGGRLRLGGPGEPVEWLVEMRRFDRGRELDRLCDEGGLTTPMVERLADALAAAHRAAPETPEFGDLDDQRARIEQIADALVTALGDARGEVELPSDAARWRKSAQAACEANAALIGRRHRLGRTRRCHGDLHLGNVVLLGDRPTPFDAIEFNEAIASIDVLYDLALTLSDLLTRERVDLANVLMNRYLSATRDYGGVAIMPLFLSMRGAVRAMTAASRGDVAEARRDLAFALAALAPAPPPRLVAVGGISGTGKSTLARRLAPRLGAQPGAVVIRADVARKRLWGENPETRLPPEAYTPAMNRKVRARMAFDARVALRAGAAVALDATFLDPAARDCVTDLARAEGVRFEGLWLEAPVDEAMARVERRTGDVSDATVAVVARQAANVIRPTGWRRLNAFSPSGESRRPEDVAAEAWRMLGPPG